jgi:serine phosphatase RsbU (regulator of sigma subunit)
MGMNKICPQCQQNNPEEARFCMTCGALLDMSSASLLDDNKPDAQALGNELTQLLSLADSLQAGLGGILVLTGDGGIGKSELIQAWHQLLVDRKLLDDLTWIDLVPIEMTQMEDYAYIRQLLQLLPGNEKSENQRGSGNPGSQFQSSLISFIQQSASKKPLLIVLEDLQRADPASVAILQSSLDLAFASPVLFCLVSRIDRSSAGWQLVTKVNEFANSHTSHIHLAPLNRQQTGNLITTFLGVHSEPVSLVDKIFVLTNGNPGYTLEIMHALIEKGVIKRSGKNWRIPRVIETILIPGSLVDHFRSSLDELPLSSRTVLETASVIGTTFQKDLITRIPVKVDPGMGINQQLALLEARGMIHISQVRPEITYTFSQPILQVITYNQLSPSEQARLHQVVARTMVELYPEKLDSLATKLAEHFISAGDQHAAGQYYALAADQALEHHANPEAEELYRKALMIVRDQVDKASLLSGLGQALAQQSLHSEAIRTWENAAKLFQQAGDFPHLARVYAWMARSAWWNNDYQESLDLCLAGWEQVKDQPETVDHAYLIHELGRAYFFMNEMEKAQAYCEQALKITKHLKAYDVQAEVLATMGILPTLHPQKAISALRASIRIAEDKGLKSTASRAYVNLAAVIENMGGVRLARDHRVKALKIGQESILASDEALIIGSIINSEIWMGEFQAAREHLVQLRILSQQSGSKDHTHLSVILLEGQLERSLGNVSRSIELFSELVKEAASISDVDLVQQGNYFLAEIFLESVFLEEGVITAEKVGMAEGFIQNANAAGENTQPGYFLLSQLTVIAALKGDQKEADRLFSLLKSPVFGSNAYSNAIISLTDARLVGVSNQLELALQRYEKSLPIFKKMEARWWTAHIMLEMAIMHILKNEPEDNESAQALLREALADFREMGCDYYPDVIIDKLRIVRQQVRDHTATNRKNKRELDEAGKVQTSFIPANLPTFPGWQIAATLEPARETSGDFFDFIVLPDDKIGIVIADVGDKGAGAALYMAMCRTLFRSYASTYPDDPAKVITSVNERIMSDTQKGIFLTAVYAILNPATSDFIYANAGHNPPCLLSPTKGSTMNSLERTGTLIGIFPESIWTNRSLRLVKGDILVLFTDGVTEAQDEHDVMYENDRFYKVLLNNREAPASGMMSAILQDVRQFIGNAPIFDDITLIVIKREK